MDEGRGLLRAVLERPDDDARKLVYADWLEERGDPRAEYIRLMMQVRQGRAATLGQRRRHQELSLELAGQVRQRVPARLQELAAALDPAWLAAVSDPEIEGCGKGPAEAWRLRFDFVCDRSWSDLEPTDDGTVRHCEGCGKNVFFCDN